ncbi:MAG: hypothetical protein AB7O78_02655 [Thermoleophilia bacterium]
MIPRFQATPAETTYAQVVAHFPGRSPGAAERLRLWREQPGKRDKVVPFVERCVTRFLYDVTPGDVEQACERTIHALGSVNGVEARSVSLIVDWHPAFAFQHVLHFVLEDGRRVPAYQDLRDRARASSEVQMMLTQPAQDTVSQAIKDGTDRELARDAMRWRVGNAYLSFLRELYVISVLREAGVDARYHVLADVLFRVDCWVDDLCLSLSIKNEKFLDGATGRKTPAEEIVTGGPFRFARLELPTRHEYGNVHLPDRDDILGAADGLTGPRRV